MLRQLTGSLLAKRLLESAIDDVTPLALRSLAAAAPMLSQTTSLVSTLNLPNSTHSPAQFVPLKSFAATAAATPLDTTIDTPTASIIPLVQYTNQGSGHDIEVPLYNINGEEIGKHVLGGDIFNVPIREDILYRVVRWQLAKKQAGTHKAKTRSEVRGGGRKPWKQKGSGRARAGSIRSPLWRGGGKAHGPVVRSHAHDLPKRVRRLGLKIAVSAKAWERRLKVVDSLRPEDYKTKTMAGHLEKLLEGAPRRSVLFCDSDKEGLDGGENLRLSTGNLPWVDTIPQIGLNVYSILQRDYLVISKDALEMLTERLRKPIKPNSLTP